VGRGGEEKRARGAKSACDCIRGGARNFERGAALLEKWGQII